MASTTSVTFRPDNFALEPNETIVLDLNLLAVSPGARMAEFDDILPNVFFQRRLNLTIQDSTGIARATFIKFLETTAN